MDRPRLIKELSEGPGSGILHALGTFLLLIVTVVLFSVRWTLSYDPVVGAESLMLRAPEPVRIALPGVASPAAHRYSRWQCVGGLEDVDSFEHRACVFSDVCYDTAAADFVFYAPPRNASVPIVYDHRRGAQRRFRHRRRDGDAVDADFVALSKWTPYRQHLSWSPSVHVGTVPSSGVQLRGLHALSAPFVPTNLGHVAWDEAFPLLVAMAQLGVYSTTLQIVRTAGCDVLPAASRHVCAKFAAAFLEPLLGVRGACRAHHPHSSRLPPCRAMLVLASPRLASPLLSSPLLSSPRLSSPLLSSPLLSSPRLASPHLTSPRLASPHRLPSQVRRCSPCKSSSRRTRPLATSASSRSSSAVRTMPSTRRLSMKASRSSSHPISSHPMLIPLPPHLIAGKEPLLALYRARVLAWHAVPIHPPTRKHTILIVNKEGASLTD
jgi:hypothetical protein